MTETLTIPIAGFGDYLSTRNLGAQVRLDVEAKIRTAVEGTVVLLDFHKVVAITISFADEFLGRLCSARAAGDLPDVGLVVSGLNDDLREAIDLCLERRELAIVELEPDGTTVLLAGDDFLRAAFEQALNLAEFRAGQLADALEITPQNANNRLKRLVASGVLRRERARGRAGKEYAYSVPAAALRPAADAS